MDRPAFWTEGLRFSCTQCSHCCRHESGYVFLSPSDLSAISGFLRISDDECIEKYCRWVPFGFIEHLSLREHHNRDCVFWQDGGCTVYDARPAQCRTYPFWSTIVETEVDWMRESRECPGIGIGRRHYPEDIEAAIVKRQDSTPIVRPGGVSR